MTASEVCSAQKLRKRIMRPGKSREVAQNSNKSNRKRGQKQC